MPFCRAFHHSRPASHTRFTACPSLSSRHLRRRGVVDLRFKRLPLIYGAPVKIPEPVHANASWLLAKRSSNNAPELTGTPVNTLIDVWPIRTFSSILPRILILFLCPGPHRRKNSTPVVQTRLSIRLQRTLKIISSSSGTSRHPTLVSSSRKQLSSS